MLAAWDGVRAAYQRRLEQFRRLDRDKLMSDAEIAQRMGVSRRSVWRYRAAERAAGRGWHKNAPTVPLASRRQRGRPS
jgi:Homeodomain-like domain